jgi:hypothetical protein
MFRPPVPRRGDYAMTRAVLASRRRRALALLLVLTPLLVLPWRLTGADWSGVLYWCIAVPVVCVFAYAATCVLQGDPLNVDGD